MNHSERWSAHSLALIFLVATIMGCSSSQSSPPAAAIPLPDAAEFAIVELFTSQGCSSCPPADQALTNIVEWSGERKLPVYCLSFHVDYWNQLGWHDPYSHNSFSKRQRAYTDVLKNRKPYTPQMVINGNVEFVGAREEYARQMITAALEEVPLTSIQLELALVAAGSEADVTFAVDGLRDQSVLHFAVVQAGLSNRVATGENAGRSLQHSHVVREFRSVRIDRQPRGQVTLGLPDNVNLADLQIIAYSQHRESLEITGAASARLVPRILSQPDV